MRLPATSAANVFLLDASRKYLNFRSGTTNVVSVQNRVNPLPVIQTTAAAQPAWTTNGLQGTYSWRNNPGANVVGTPGIDALGFVSASSQYMEYDTLASQFSGTETAFTMVSLASCTNPSSGTNTIWSAAATGGSTPILSLHATGGNIVFTETSSGGTVTATASTDTNPHVVTCIRTATNITLRIDGVQAATTTITSPAAQTYNTFCVGSQNSNGTNGSFFGGEIALLSMYLGAADIDEVEAYLLLRSGIQRGNVFNS